MITDFELRLNPLLTARAGDFCVFATDEGPRSGVLRELDPLLAEIARRVAAPVGPVGVMGVLNVTPDSFSDGGQFFNADAAVAHGRALRAAGAGLIDVGGESTRPGAEPISVEEELRRVLPVVKALAPVSIDTRNAAVARAAIEAGATVVNDVSALGDPGMADVVARSGASLILMHMRGDPRTMQDDPRYDDVVADVARYLRAAAKKALSAGVPADRIMVDPGIGFGKRLEHNLELLRRLAQLRSLGFPIVVGTSRKRFIGELLDRPVEQRKWGTAASVAAAVLRGARWVRVHDVHEMNDVARLAARLRETE